MMKYWTTGEGMSDVNELRDDADRWAHYADAHQVEMAQGEAPLREWEMTPDYQARSYSAVERERRFMALSWWLEHKRLAMVQARRRGKNEEVERLRRSIEQCVSGIKQRYTAAVKLIVGRGQNEWWLLYLKREQKDDLLTLARDAWVGR